MPRLALPRPVVGLIALALLSVGLGAAPRAEAQTPVPWGIVTLRPLVEGEDTHVYDVNDAGYAVGTSEGKPVLWSPDGSPAALPLPAGETKADALAINDHGIVVGSTGPEVGDPPDAIAWVYGTIVPITSEAMVYDVNDQNVVAGCRGADDEGQDAHPFVAQIGAAPVDLAVDPATPFGCAYSVSDWGGVAGVQETSSTQVAGIAKGRLWFQGQTFDFDGTPQHVSAVTSISDSAFSLLRIAALASPNQPTHAALAAPDGSYSVLEPIRASSTAADLNVHGVVVGNRPAEGGETVFGPTQPVMWVYGTTVPMWEMVRDHRYPVTSQGNAHIGKVANGTPTAISDTFRIAGNSPDGTSWVIVPPA